MVMNKTSVSDSFDLFMNRKNWSKYSGEWIAICDDKIISNHSNLKKVIKESSKKCKDKIPTFTKIPDKHAAMAL